MNFNYTTYNPVVLNCYVPTKGAWPFHFYNLVLLHKYLYMLEWEAIFSVVGVKENKTNSLPGFRSLDGMNNCLKRCLKTQSASERCLCFTENYQSLFSSFKTYLNIFSLRCFFPSEFQKYILFIVHILAICLVFVTSGHFCIRTKSSLPLVLTIE